MLIEQVSIVEIIDKLWKKRLKKFEVEGLEIDIN